MESQKTNGDNILPLSECDISAADKLPPHSHSPSAKLLKISFASDKSHAVPSASVNSLHSDDDKRDTTQVACLPVDVKDNALNQNNPLANHPGADLKNDGNIHTELASTTDAGGHVPESKSSYEDSYFNMPGLLYLDWKFSQTFCQPINPAVDSEKKNDERAVWKPWANTQDRDPSGDYQSVSPNGHEHGQTVIANPYDEMVFKYKKFVQELNLDRNLMRNGFSPVENDVMDSGAISSNCSVNLHREETQTSPGSPDEVKEFECTAAQSHKLNFNFISCKTAQHSNVGTEKDANADNKTTFNLEAEFLSRNTDQSADRTSCMYASYENDDVKNQHIALDRVAEHLDQTVQITSPITESMNFIFKDIVQTVCSKFFPTEIANNNTTICDAQQPDYNEISLLNNDENKPSTEPLHLELPNIYGTTQHVASPFTRSIETNLPFWNLNSGLERRCNCFSVLGAENCTCRGGSETSNSSVINGSLVTQSSDDLSEDNANDSTTASVNDDANDMATEDLNKDDNGLATVGPNDVNDSECSNDENNSVSAVWNHEPSDLTTVDSNHDSAADKCSSDYVVLKSDSSSQVRYANRKTGEVLVAYLPDDEFMDGDRFIGDKGKRPQSSNYRHQCCKKSKYQGRCEEF